MNVNDALEQKAVEIKVGGEKKEISEIEGVVKDVYGFNELIKIKPKGHEIFAGPPPSYYQRHLSISLDSETSTHHIPQIKFIGTSPVRGGDRIRAGLIVDSAFPKEAIYVGILKEDDSYERIDFMNGYDPQQEDTEKLRV